jgi:hypothetical protein
MQTRTTVRVVLVATIALLAGSCSQDPASGRMADLVTQSGSYHENARTLRLAEDLLVRECLSSKGFEYPAATPTPAPELEDERRQEGYGLFPSSGRNQRSAVDRYVERLSPEQQRAFDLALFGPSSTYRAIRLPGGEEYGFPGEGCLAESRTRLFADLTTWARVERVPQLVNSQISEHAIRDSRYAEAIREWSVCMRKRGYDYRTPQEAHEDLAARYRKDGASQRLRRQEVRTAVTDAECARDERIVPLVLSLKHELLRTQPEAERQALSELADAWLAAVAEARRVLTGNPSPPT